MAARKENVDILVWLEKNFNLDKVVIDIGSKKGKWFRSLRSRFPTNISYLFEPIPSNFNKIQKTLQSDKFYTAYNIALSNKEGNMSFYVDLETISWSGLVKQKTNGKYKTIEVEVRTLDSFKFQNVGLIKIDVEGNELYTLQGSIETIKLNQPIIYFECADVHLLNYDYTAKDLYNFFHDLDYSIYTIDEKNVDLDLFLKYSYEDSSYYHNFIAVPKEKI